MSSEAAGSNSAHLRAAVINTARAMNRAGINSGNSGNVSCRSGDGFLITPSGVPYDSLGPTDIVEMSLDGTWAASMDHAPSSEWRFHKDIYVARGDVDAVVHAHPTNTTALAVHGRGIDAFHYMVAIAGGHDIRCADYATFGTQQLSASVVKALDGRLACLIAHHGLVAVGGDLDQALLIATEVETLASQYMAALQLGPPPLLSHTEMSEVLEKFAAGRGYGSS